jgi:hypothetical protein
MAGGSTPRESGRANVSIVHFHLPRVNNYLFYRKKNDILAFFTMRAHKCAAFTGLLNQILL